MHSIRTKVLETQFKNSTAKLQQAIKRTKYELDVDMLASYCVYRDNTLSYVNNNECYIAIQNQYNSKGVHRRSSRLTLYYDINRSGEVYNFNKTFNFVTNDDTPNGVDMPIYIVTKMLDGTYIGMSIVSGTFIISLDINGASGPNRFGYDIFYLYVATKDDSLTGYKWNGIDYTDEDLANVTDTGFGLFASSRGWPCSKTSTQNYNGIGCGWYAIHDICPFDNKPGYFRCLP